MDTRTTKEVQVFTLNLNNMRSAKIEYLTIAAVSDRKGALEELLERESVPGYRDGHWGKGFRRGGPLEWFNESLSDNKGISHEWIPLDEWERIKSQGRHHIEP